MLQSELARKLELLQKYIRALGEVTVGYSGGVDSAVVAQVAFDVLGEKAKAVTVVTEFEARRDIEIAIETARHIGINHELVEHSILAHAEVAENPTNRCFFCKHNSFSAIDGPNRLDGNNASDDPTDRPGMQALVGLGVKSPLRDCGISKEEVRQLARAFGLPVADRPANSCLASRIKHGTRVTRELLNTVERGEDLLHLAGLRDVRLRHRGARAIVEVSPSERDIFLREEHRIITGLKELGFDEVELGARNAG